MTEGPLNDDSLLIRGAFEWLNCLTTNNLVEMKIIELDR